MIRALSSRCYTIYHHHHTHMPSKAASSININGAFDNNIIFPPKKKSIYDRRKTRQKKYTGEWATQASWKSEGFMSVCACKRTRTPYRPTSNLAHWKCASPLRALHLSARAHRLSHCTHARMRVMLTQESSVPLVTPPSKKATQQLSLFLCKSHPPIPQLPPHQWNVGNKGPTMKFS